ncbi:MAG: hypothetical protein AAGE85_02230 [Pseudomonadota bacterium]
MNKVDAESDGWAKLQGRNTKNLRIWTGVWLVSLALANFGPKFLWDHHSLLSLSSIVVNVALGIGMIVANGRLLNGLDEMQRQIQIEAMAVALGVGLVFGLAYSTLDVVNLISFDAEISHLVMLVAVVFMVTVALGLRRVR